jgi:BirA family biotin operon repressor/biotin-[acetyl-CoA-carboxylase] ligase
LSLATGVAITRALEATPHTNTDRFTPRIKWPNDIWVNDQKLAGILVEVCGQAQQRCVVIGVGVNLYPPTGVLSHSGVAPTGLVNYMGDGVPPDASAVVSNCVVQLVNMLRQFKRNGFETFAAEFDALDALKGRALHLSDGSQGTALGVDAEGGLRLQGASGAVQTIISQEVSVRPCVSQ